MWCERDTRVKDRKNESWLTGTEPQKNRSGRNTREEKQETRPRLIRADNSLQTQFEVNKTYLVGGGRTATEQQYLGKTT